MTKVTAISTRPERTPRSSRPEPNTSKTRVFLICSGLGNVRRGYETFIRDCYDVLSAEPMLDVWLFKGAGPGGGRDISLPHLRRGGLGARVVGELTGRGSYVVEQVTFATMLIPHLMYRRPSVVYYCDPSVGKLLWYWRRLTGARYRLLLHNGGPHAPPFRWCDHVHQLTPAAHAAALAAGHEPSRQTLIPCGISFGPAPRPITAAERASRRSALGLPPDRPVVLSVGALNRGHKRMDYLIQEIASLPAPRPFLAMLGEAETESAAVRATAELLLGPQGFLMRTVPRDAIDRYYRAADIFALASLKEAFGLGYVEALAHGLPCVAHDFPVSRFVLNGQGLLGDLRRPGVLAALVQSALSLPDSLEARSRRYHAASRRFGWPVLAREYAAMMHQCARRAPTSSTAPAPDPVQRIRIEAGASTP